MALDNLGRETTESLTYGLEIMKLALVSTKSDSVFTKKINTLTQKDVLTAVFAVLVAPGERKILSDAQKLIDQIEVIAANKLAALNDKE